MIPLLRGTKMFDEQLRLKVFLLNKTLFENLSLEDTQKKFIEQARQNCVQIMNRELRKKANNRIVILLTDI